MPNSRYSHDHRRKCGCKHDKRGPTGPTGQAGQMGATGATGAIGPMGPAGQNCVSPCPAPCTAPCATNGNKKINVGFIDEPQGALTATIPYILSALKRFTNIANVQFSFIPNFVNTGTPSIQAQADAVEAAVIALYNQGFNYIIFGCQSTYINPWTTGGTPNLGGINEQQRFQDSQIFFGYNNLIATQTYIANLLSNCFSMTDVNPNIPTKIAAIEAFTSGSGIVYFVYQSGDAVSLNALAQYTQAAAQCSPVRTVVSQAITASSFPEIASTVIPYINSTLPANSVVMFAVNGSSSDQDGLTNAINAGPAITNGTVTLFGANYGPTTVTLNYDLQEYAISGPFYNSPYLVELGFSNNPTFTTLASSLFIESMGYLNAMVDGKPWHGTDGTQRFDVFKSYVAPLIIQYYYPSGTFNPVINLASTQTNSLWISTINDVILFPL